MPYDNELKFALFKNDKGDNAKRPDYRGECTVKGVAYKMSAWLADTKKGDQYIRGVIEFDEKKNGAPQQSSQQQPSPLRSAPPAQATPPAAATPSAELSEDVPW